ncbi:MAG: hypothetical protein JWN71_2788 [Xanthobacteraceae bacterium]|nr:hypothetical protein [Xanthobacteraceae bacterium]
MGAIVPLKPIPQPWKPAVATDEIRRIARSDGMKLTRRDHACERMDERSLLMGDLLYALKNGFVYEDPEPSTQAGLFKYRIESQTPNSGNRSVRIVVIPDAIRSWLKVITVMWVDE